MSPMNDPRTLNVHPLLAIVAALAVTAGHASLDASLDGALDRELGPAVAIGQGTARSFVELDGEGKPTTLGVIVTEDALEGLPDGHGHHENVLDLPAIEGIPFRHITFDWNPAGHEPEGVYNRPHFDVHFYTISDAERRTITPERPDFAERGARLPEAPWRPAGYMPDPNGAVPLMGTHWIDPQTPELNGQPFTETLIFGSWDGALIFIEPMLTREWLLSKPELREPLAMPANVGTAGYWPSHWSVRYDADRREYRIALEGLEHRDAR